MIVDVLNGLADNIAKDTFSYNSTNTVVISCNNRGTVTGILSEALKLSVKAEYQNFTSYGTDAKKIIEFADAAVTTFTGATVQQPWFARQYWTSTSPLTISVKISFIATDNAKEQVWDPIERLIGFHYPRQLTESASGLANLYAPPGPNLFSGKDSSGHMTNGILDGTPDFNGGVRNPITGKTYEASFNLGKTFKIQGAEEPDYVSFRLGSLVTLEMCYLQGSEIVFSPALDPDGYPHSATATVNIRAFDGSYWPLKGGFHLTQQAGISFSVGTALDAVKSLFSKDVA